MLFMSGDELKKQIKKWAKRVGEQRAKVELVTAGLGLSTVEKLLKGTYVSEPKERVAEILHAALSRDETQAS
jgi:hypothetical protein